MIHYGGSFLPFRGLRLRQRAKAETTSSHIVKLFRTTFTGMCDFKLHLYSLDINKTWVI